MWRRESSRIRGSAIIPMTRNGRLATIERRASLPRKRPILTFSEIHRRLAWGTVVLLAGTGIIRHKPPCLYGVTPLKMFTAVVS